MDSIRRKTKELLMYHCGCYGNLVTIATKYVAGVYHPIPNIDLKRLNFHSAEIHFCNIVVQDPTNFPF